MDEATFKQRAKDFPRIALFRELSADHLTPVQAFLAVGGECLLESSPEGGLGRHSYIGADPILRIVDPAQGFEALKEARRSLNVAADHPLALFAGGLVGFLSYDAIRYKENIPDRHRNQKGFPDLSFSCYRTSVIFDHAAERLIVATIVEVSADPELDYRRGQEELGRLEALLASPPALSSLKCGRKNPVEESLCAASYANLVERAKRYILSGDVFQIVLSRSFDVQVKESGLDIYRSLRQKSQAPYLFYFDVGGVQILGASPEQLVTVKGRLVQTSPIAGTRPIDGDPAELLSDPKEVAEHMMLVDLARNDLGAVCKPGSVKVNKLMEVRRFTHVMHIVSTVEGILEEALDPIDALVHAFPAGTLTGAPKIRAMELIDELEDSRRGLYGGAIVGVAANGDLDSCIAIRMGVLRNGRLSVRAGAGLVFDSAPDQEAEETKHKARTVVVAAGGGE